jgi:cis-3-alkyl-4-acyloxetan-2-one decarboxylase
VMVHGNPTWSFYYRNLVNLLKDRYRCIVPDHVGCGYSDKPDDAQYNYTLKQRIDDLDALLDHLGVSENVTLIVHDWGGMIGMGWASRHPERIARLVILNTAAFHLPKSKPFPPALRLGRNTGIGAFMIRAFNAFCVSAAKVCVKRNPLPQDVKQAYLEPYNSWQNRIAVARFVQDIPLKPSDPSYAVVEEVQQGLHRFKDKPMMICWGSQDFVFSDHFLEEWIKFFPAAQVHRFPDYGHYILEDAAAEIEALIKSFFECHPLVLEPTAP